MKDSIFIVLAPAQLMISLFCRVLPRTGCSISAIAWFRQSGVLERISPSR